MAAKAALIAGSGLVTVAVPERLHTIMECKLTEAMTSSIPSKDGLVFSSESLNPIIKMLTGKTSILLGPGLGTEPETKKFVFDLLKEIEIPIIIDADGLNALEDEWEKISALKKNIILTPHPGEMSRMVKMNTSDLLANQIKLTTSFSKRKNIYIVLKHARSLIATPDGNYFINITGNPGLASGGTGDILAGYIAGLSAQQYTAEESLLAGVFLHGLASDLAVKDIGEKELIASDILEYFSKARWLIESDPTPFQGIYVPYQFPDYSEGNFHD